MSRVNFTISNFGINTFDCCSQKFKLKFIDKVNRSKEITNKYFSFDKSIHAVMAYLNTIPLNSISDKNTLLALIEDNWISAGYDSKNEEMKFKYRAFKIITQYIDNPKDIGDDNLIVNKVLQMKTNNNSIITAKIDKVYERFDNNLEVVDYKTASVINKSLNFNSNFQLPLYLLLIYKKLEIYPYAISYYYLT